MKQHITAKQLGKLNAKAKEKLDSWFIRQPYKYTITALHKDGKIKFKSISPLLTIGQMIEFLENKSLEGWFCDEYGKNWRVRVFGKYYQSEELCDALWEAVKKVLQND